MNSATKQVAAVTIIAVIAGLCLVVLFDQNSPEADVVSEIDNIGYRIDDVGVNVMNVTLEISVNIENYGRLKNVIIECSEIQSYLVIKNNTVPLVSVSDLTDQNPVFLDNQSYILDGTFLTPTCDNEATVYTISENVINQLVVAVPFRFITGSYSFTWFHSFADRFLAGSVDIDTDLQTVIPHVEAISEE